MKCQTVKSRLADLSAEHLSVQLTSEVYAHIEHCAGCKQEWVIFQTSMRLLSSTPQPVLTSEQSKRLWEACEAKARSTAQQPAGQQPGGRQARTVGTDNRRPGLDRTK